MAHSRSLMPSFAAFKAAAKRKPKLPAAHYAARFAAEQALQLARFCDALAAWRACPRRYCHRHRSCGGDRHACLRRALGRVPPAAAWRARQDILDATPPNIGAPERAARQRLPGNLYSTIKADDGRR